MITSKDHKGNIIKQRALTYTPDGQIKSIKDTTQDNQGNQTEKLIATYAYNHLRQRIAKTVYQKDNQTNQTKEETTQYLWDKGLLSAEIKDDKVIRRYVYLDIMPVAVLDYTYQDNKGKVHDKPIKTQVYSIHTDHLGTPKQITNQNKEVVWSIEMDTFGETKSIESKNNFTFNLRFAGQYFDQESGYHYNYHRYYDPQIGRYLTSDPIGLAGGLNSYGYANSEPWGAVDWLGLDALYVTYPDYKASWRGERWAGTGHAAVVIIDPTGLTKYYEYGRYETPLGKVVKHTIPNVVIGSDGRATAESLAKLLKAMSNLPPKSSHKYGKVTVDYHDRADNIQAMQDYVDFRMSENGNKDRKPYNIYANNCMSFAKETILQGYDGLGYAIGKGGRILGKPLPDSPYLFQGREMEYNPETNTFTWKNQKFEVK